MLENLKTFLKRFRTYLFLFFSRGAIFLALIVGIFFNLFILTNFKKDTTDITNTGFVILASLAALSFGFSRSLEKDDKKKDRIVYCGERFLHAAILMLVASLLKYTNLTIQNLNFIQLNGFWIKFLSYPLHMFVSLFFFYSIMSAHTGLKIINDILWKRLTSQPDWDDIF